MPDHPATDDRTDLERRFPDDPESAPEPEPEDIDTDPPGVRSERFARDSDLRLNHYVQTLRAERSRLSAHTHRTTAYVHAQVDRSVEFAQRRVAVMLRDLARMSVGRAEAETRVSDDVALVLVLDPTLVKRVHAEVDKLEIAPHDREPRSRELSWHEPEALRAEIERLSNQINAHEHELDMRPRRRQRIAAEQAEANREARWARHEEVI
jgi:hypothetical protein